MEGLVLISFVDIHGKGLYSIGYSIIYCDSLGYSFYIKLCANTVPMNLKPFASMLNIFIELPIM